MAIAGHVSQVVFFGYVGLMDIVAVIEEALARRGISAAAASKAAAGNQSFIKNIKAGSSPTLRNLERLADVLGLEIYVGPPRHDAAHLHDGSIRHDGAPPPRAAPDLSRIAQALGLPPDTPQADIVAAAARLTAAVRAARETAAAIEERAAEIREVLTSGG